MIAYIQSHYEVLALLVFLLISEVLPFSDSVKSNGIFQAILAALKGPAKSEADKIAKK